MKILHIVSYPRSGSTILGVAFGQFKEAIYLGEVSALFTHTWKRNCGCSLHEPVNVMDCPIWGPILSKSKELLEKNNLWDNNYIGLLKELRLTFLKDASKQIEDKKPSLELRIVKEILTIVFQEASEIGNAEIVVDSSKELEYYKILNKCFGQKHIPLHLFRDSRGVVYSARKNPAVQGKATPLSLGRSSRIAFGWGAKNLLIERLIKNDKGKFKSYKLLYEDWCQNPKIITEKIIADITGRKRTSSPFTDKATFKVEPNHSFFGNRSRKSTGTVTIKSDQSWRNNLSKQYKIAATLASGIFLKRNGYHVLE